MTDREARLVAALKDALALAEQYQAELRHRDELQRSGFCQGAWFTDTHRRIAEVYAEATGDHRFVRRL